MPRGDTSPPHLGNTIEATFELSPMQSHTPNNKSRGGGGDGFTSNTNYHRLPNDSFDTSVIMDPHNTSMDPRQIVATSVEIFDLREQVQLMKEQVIDAQEESRRSKLLCIQVRKELHELTKQEDTSQTYSAIASLLGNTTSLVEKFALFEKYLRESISAEAASRDEQLKADARSYSDEQSSDVADGVRKVLESFRGRIESCNSAIQQEETSRVEECASLRSLMTKVEAKQDSNSDEMGREMVVRLDPIIKMTNDLRNQFESQQSEIRTLSALSESHKSETRAVMDCHENDLRKLADAQKSTINKSEQTMRDLLDTKISPLRQSSDELRLRTENELRNLSESQKRLVVDAEKALRGDIRECEDRVVGRVVGSMEGKISGSRQVGQEALDSVEGRCKQLQRDLDAAADIQKRETSKLENRLSKIEDSQLSDLERQIGRLEAKVAETFQDTSRQERDLKRSQEVALASFQDKVDTMIRSKDQQLEDLSKSFDGKHAKLSEKVDTAMKASDKLDTAIQNINKTLSSEVQKVTGSVQELSGSVRALEQRIEQVADVTHACGTRVTTLQRDQTRISEMVEKLIATSNSTDSTTQSALSEIRHKLEGVQKDITSSRNTASSSQTAALVAQTSALEALESKIFRIQEAAFGAQEREWKSRLTTSTYQTRIALSRLLLSTNVKRTMGNIFTKWKARATGKIMRGALSKYHDVMEDSMSGRLCDRERMFAKRIVGLLGNDRASGVSGGGSPALHRLYNSNDQRLLKEGYRKLREFAATKFNPRVRQAITTLGKDMAAMGEGHQVLRGNIRRLEDNLSKVLGTNSSSLSPDEKSLLANNPRMALQHTLQRFFAGESSLSMVLRALLANTKYFDQDQLRQDEDVKVLSDWVRVIDEEIRKVQRCVRPAFK